MELNQRRRPSGWRLGALRLPRGLPVIVGAAAIAVLALSIGLRRSDDTSPVSLGIQPDALDARDRYYVLEQFSLKDLLRSSSSSQISLERTPMESDSLSAPRRVQQDGGSGIVLVSF